MAGNDTITNIADYYKKFYNIGTGLDFFLEEVG